MSNSFATEISKKCFTAVEAFNFSSRIIEIICWLSISFILVLFALTLEPFRTGDGAYYYAMLMGLAENGSPEITEAIRTAVIGRTGGDPIGLTITTSDGHVYAAHFFAYPLLCVPAYTLLDAAGIDNLKAFQLTNALIEIIALFYVMLLSRQNAATRWMTVAGFVLSTGTIYFQWTHPEVFSAAFVLTASVAFLDRRYALAAAMAAVGALQNPSVVLLVLPIIIGQSLELSEGRFRNLFTHKAIASLAITGAATLISLAPYVWNYFQFGHPNSIARLRNSGYIDYSLISTSRLISFVFDLNQGLIIGLPLLLWAVPVAVIFRITESIQNRGCLFRREDLLLFGFLLMAIPTLAQTNWNGGHSVFLRYASWAGMASLVWAAITVGRQQAMWLAAGLIPAIALQLSMQIYIGGIHLPRFRPGNEFQPWIMPIWHSNPHFYNPVPEIFFRRVTHRGRGKITTPTVLREDSGIILRVLTLKNDIQDISEEVCGKEGKLEPSDQRKTSKPRLIETEKDLHYLTGRLACAFPLPGDLFLTPGSTRTGVLTGWSKPESQGTWSLGKVSSLKLRISAEHATEIGMRFKGHAFVNNLHTEQTVRVHVNGRLIDTWRFNYPHGEIDKQLSLDGSILDANSELKIEFGFPNAISPSQLGLSGDKRMLGINLNSVHFEKLR